MGLLSSKETKLNINLDTNSNSNTTTTNNNTTTNSTNTNKNTNTNTNTNTITNTNTNTITNTNTNTITNTNTNTNTNTTTTTTTTTTTIDDNEILPPIRFINIEDLKKLKSFPRYPENANICINEEDINRYNSLLIFISHCWLRGWNGAEGWDGRPHPDNIKHEKFQLILKGIEFMKRQAPGMKDIYIWIDYGCINQNADPAGELKQLDKIVQACDLVLTVITDNEWNEWEFPSSIDNWYKDYKSKSWNDGDYAYLNRCWCRVEMMYAANVPLYNDTDIRLKKFTAGLANAIKSNRRPHYLYGTKEKMTNMAPIGLPPLRNTFFDTLYNPLTGSITKESDRIKIKELIEALQPYININRSHIGYDGERNELGEKHGLGTYRYDDSDIYIGEYKNDKMHGRGTYMVGNGSVYVGEYEDDKKNGYGTYTFANGNVYEGTWKNDKMHGYGTYTFASGNVYIGEYINGKKNGYGTFTNVSNGNVYEGLWKDGLKNGMGKTNYGNGDIHIGQYKDGNINGQGKFIHAFDKTTSEGMFKDGIFLQEIKIMKNNDDDAINKCTSITIDH